jgi:hypothetical protein
MPRKIEITEETAWRIYRLVEEMHDFLHQSKNDETVEDLNWWLENGIYKDRESSPSPTTAPASSTRPASWSTNAPCVGWCSRSQRQQFVKQLAMLVVDHGFDQLRTPQRRLHTWWGRARKLVGRTDVQEILREAERGKREVEASYGGRPADATAGSRPRPVGAATPRDPCRAPADPGDDGRLADHRHARRAHPRGRSPLGLERRLQQAALVAHRGVAV